MEVVLQTCPQQLLPPCHLHLAFNRDVALRRLFLRSSKQQQQCCAEVLGSRGGSSRCRSSSGSDSTTGSKCRGSMNAYGCA